MEIVHATWARGGVFAFFSGNEAGVLRSLSCVCPSFQQPVLVGPSLRWSQIWHVTGAPWPTSGVTLLALTRPLRSLLCSASPAQRFFLGEPSLRS